MNPAAPSSRSEPLLWLQLLGLAAIPLEALLLFLLLAGADPGPVPGLERLLCWSLGSLAPAFLLWRMPPDVWSLLLVQVPLRGRRPLQQRLSALQGGPLLQAGLVIGSGLCLGLLWWLDDHAALAAAFSPLAGGPRLVALLLAAAVLALMLWQWQQLLQSLWLLSRSPDRIAAAEPMAADRIASHRLGLGIPLLLLDPLVMEPPRHRPSGPAAEVPASSAGADPAPASESPPDTRSPEPATPALDRPSEAASGIGAAVAVEPEKGAADEQGDGLDQQIG